MKASLRQMDQHTLLILFKHGWLSGFINITGACYVYLFFQLSHPTAPQIYINLCAVLITAVISTLIARLGLRAAAITRLKRYYRYYYLSVFANSLSWGLLYLINVSHMSEIQHLFMMLTLVGASAVSIVALAGSLVCFLLFLLPIMGILIFVNIHSPDTGFRLLGISLILYSFFILFIYLLNRRTLLENAALLTNQQSLIDGLNHINEKLNIASLTDSLTNLANYRYFKERLSEDWHRCRRAQLPLSLLLIDIDFFKEYNDLYGHIEGDKCLKIIGKIIGNHVNRNTDLAARPGGDEFAIILYNTDISGARFQGLSILNAIQDYSLRHEKSKIGKVTVSIGVATIIPTIDNRDEEYLIRLADEALYKAKEQGRNQLV